MFLWIFLFIQLWNTNNKKTRNTLSYIQQYNLQKSFMKKVDKIVVEWINKADHDLGSAKLIYYELQVRDSRMYYETKHDLQKSQT